MLGRPPALAGATTLQTRPCTSRQLGRITIFDCFGSAGKRTLLAKALPSPGLHIHSSRPLAESLASSDE
eukprot:8617170-Alexandrium_andersonii.AAC.1